MSSSKKKHVLSVHGEGLLTTHGSCRVDVVEDKNGHDDGYAIGTIYIAGCPLHLECIEVVLEGRGANRAPRRPLEAVNPIFQSRIVELEMEMDCAFMVAHFDDRQWVVIATPFDD